MAPSGVDPFLRLGHSQAMDQPGLIRAVIFDMDGVLTDSEPLICEAAVAMFHERGVRVQPEDFAPFVGTGENRYLGGVAEQYGCRIDLADAKRRTYELYLQMVPERLKAFPGATHLVRTCRAKGLRIALASSADPIKIQANLAKIQLPAGQWDAIVSGEDVTHKKPSPDIFLVAAQRMGLRPEACVVVEDAVHGIEAAKAAGMRCVAVAQTFPAGLLREADLVKQSLEDLSVEELLGHNHNK